MASRATEIQNTARFVAAAFGAHKDPRDGAAAMALAITANIWAQRPKNETAVRKVMEGLTEAVVECWKKQKEFEAGQGANHGRGDPTA